MTNYYYYRKNWGSGVLAVQLNDAAGYPDDPLYDEVAVEADHTLPGSSVTDESTMDDEFRFVIWSETINPGDDPGMEIVTVRRTTHPRVYQVVTRGEEDTPISNHPVGSYVGLHYTAGISIHDLLPIQAILDADVGSIIYTWADVYDRKEIALLPPGTSGMVLHTAGTGQPPYWDWVYGYAARTFNIHIYTGYTIAIQTISKEIQALSLVDETNLYTDYITDSYDIDVDFVDSDVSGSIEITYDLEVMDISGDSFSEPTMLQLIDESNLYTEYATAIT